MVAKWLIWFARANAFFSPCVRHVHFRIFNPAAVLPVNCSKYLISFCCLLTVFLCWYSSLPEKIGGSNTQNDSKIPGASSSSFLRCTKHFLQHPTPKNNALQPSHAACKFRSSIPPPSCNKDGTHRYQLEPQLRKPMAAFWHRYQLEPQYRKPRVSWPHPCPHQELEAAPHCQLFQQQHLQHLYASSTYLFLFLRFHMIPIPQWSTSAHLTKGPTRVSSKWGSLKTRNLFWEILIKTWKTSVLSESLSYAYRPTWKQQDYLRFNCPSGWRHRKFSEGHPCDLHLQGPLDLGIFSCHLFCFSFPQVSAAWQKLGKNWKSCRMMFPWKCCKMAELSTYGFVRHFFWCTALRLMYCGRGPI